MSEIPPQFRADSVDGGPISIPRPPRAAPSRGRAGLHLSLLALTFAAVLPAGAFWGGFYRSSFLDLIMPDALVAGLPYAIWVLAILGAHEMGHYLACRYYGIPATLPFFIPGIPPIGTFGAIIRIRGVIPDRRALFDVAAAGPLAGFAVALPALILGTLGAEPIEGPIPEHGWFFGPPLISSLLSSVLRPGEGAFLTNPVYGAGWVGMLVTSLNLFPVGQLDGGHVAYAWSRALHRRLTRLTLAALLALVAFQLVFVLSPAYLLWFVILLWMRDRHPRLGDESLSLGTVRKVVALVLGLVFLACFIPFPFSAR